MKRTSIRSRAVGGKACCGNTAALAPAKALEKDPFSSVVLDVYMHIYIYMCVHASIWGVLSQSLDSLRSLA